MMNHIEKPTSLDIVTVLNWTDNRLDVLDFQSEVAARFY